MAAVSNYPKTTLKNSDLEKITIKEIDQAVSNICKIILQQIQDNFEPTLALELCSISIRNSDLTLLKQSPQEIVNHFYQNYKERLNYNSACLDTLDNYFQKLLSSH